MDVFYTLYGEDKAFVKYQCNELIKTLDTDDIVRYDMSVTDVMDVVDDASTVAMFSDKKIIILEDSYFLIANKSASHLEVLENYIQHYNPNSYLIFLVYHDKIDTRKKIKIL